MRVILHHSPLWCQNSAVCSLRFTVALQYTHEKSSFFDLVDDPLLCGWRHQLAYGAKVGKERGDGGTRLGERFIHDYLNLF